MTITLDSISLRLLELLSEGMLSKQIAEEIGITDRTVRNKLTMIYRQLGVSNSNAAVAYYMRNHAQLQVAAIENERSLRWYTRCLFRGQWKKARCAWRESEGVLQDEATLLPLHFALLLLGDDHALAACPPLTPVEARLFTHLAAWHRGQTPHLAPLQTLLEHASHSHRTITLIALYKSAEQHKLHEIAAEALCSLIDSGYLTPS